MSDISLFMIHGMWGGAWHWDNYRDYFQPKGYRCRIPTLRHHDILPGEKPNPALGTTSLLDYLEDLQLEICSLKEKPVILGHSMGGLLAQMLASRNLARALVLLTPAAPAGISSLRLSVIKGFLSIQTQWGFWKKPVRQTFREASCTLLHNLPPAEQKKVYARSGYESGLAATQIGYWFLDRRHTTRIDENQVKCPVLIIAGGQDRMTPVSVVRKIYKKYKNVSVYREFDHHSHWLLSEPGWDGVAEFIAEWLEETLISN
ncbi:MAG: alpha/beta hydrolase [Candidatus Cloacimonetes bacterium]|nr:alpha/beta hydrolase [Candidatus Cloacimonadota bacterium]